MNSPDSNNQVSRIEELDVLRGFALLGVFVVHFVGLPYYELPLAESVKSLWDQSMVHRATVLASDFLFLNKANTLFATLFGIGFWVMLDRLEQSGRDFRALYQRRLLFLFLLGTMNTLFIFPGDVLHEYALIGLVLLWCRGLSARSMLYWGVLLALIARPVIEGMQEIAGFPEPGFDVLRAEANALPGYGKWVSAMAVLHVREDVLQGGLAGWVFYILGRFFVGSWLVRSNVIYSLSSTLPALRRLAYWALVAGLASELLTLLIWENVLIAPVWQREAIHAVGAPVLALGYAAGLVVLFHSQLKGVIREVFAPVGRIALTAYFGHGVVYGVLFLPMGMGLLSAIPPFMCLIIAISVFAFFNLLARYWLSRWGYGPLEYVWRWTTYKQKPRLRQL